MKNIKILFINKILLKYKIYFTYLCESLWRIKVLFYERKIVYIKIKIAVSLVPCVFGY